MVPVQFREQFMEQLLKQMKSTINEKRTMTVAEARTILEEVEETKTISDESVPPITRGYDSWLDLYVQHVAAVSFVVITCEHWWLPLLGADVV